MNEMLCRKDSRFPFVKVATLIVALLASLTLCLSLSGCGILKTDEDVVKDQISYDLNGLATNNPVFREQMRIQMDLSSLDAIGVDSEKVLDAYLSEFSIDIKSCKTNQKEAEVVFTVNNRSYSGYIDAIDSVARAMASDISLPKRPDNYYVTYMNDQILEKIKGVQTKTTNEIALKYHLEDTTWIPEDEVESTIVKAILVS